MSGQPPDFLNILQVLAKQKTEFIVIDSVGAVLRETPIVTFDLDVIHSRHQDNSLFSADKNAPFFST